MDNVAIINTCDNGSTGKIALGLMNYLKKQTRKVLFCYGRGKKCNNDERYRFCNPLDVYTHYAHTKLFGQLNASSTIATKRLIKRLRQKNVKEIYLINLHGYILNEKLFLQYLIKDGIRVVYIMADESAFLGNCTYRLGCEEYKNGCVNCKQISCFARNICRASANAYAIKKSLYNQIENIAFVGPEFVILSAKTSPLLNGKRLEIVDEAIDVNINTPKDTSNLRKDLGIGEEQIVIGCVAPFSYERKGVKYLIEAAKMLESDSQFIFVQVGYDIKDKSGLPSNYIPIDYIKGQDVLTQYYSLVDLFVFPSTQDTMPNACLEALACGSPLLCFNTSGMPYIGDDTVMTLVESRNVLQMVEVIKKKKKKTQETIDICRNYALKRFDNQKYFERLMTIMNSMK